MGLVLEVKNTFQTQNIKLISDHEIPVAESTQLNHHSIHLSRENSHFEASSHEPSLLDDELNRSRNSIK